jgi:hypothetical protein
MSKKVKFFKKKLKKIAKKYLLVAFALVILIALGFILDRFFPIKPTQSAATDNVSGWAWSETIGWISFNCTNTGTCGISNYGVSVDSATGDFSGYAWSENIGWISFNRADTGNPPAPPYNGGSGPIANLSFATQKVRGWARALANGGGWDGWIKLGDDSGTWPAGGNQVYIQILAGPDELRGWAWGSDVAGWIKFNCTDTPANCGTSNYKVLVDINLPPSVTCNDTEIWSYCLDSRHPTLEWNYSDSEGDPQESYQVQADETSGFSSVPLKLDTGVINSSSNRYTVSSSHILRGTDLAWNTKYYWRVKVKDDSGNWSDWCPSACNFTTPSHAYPTPDFNWSPPNPSAEENVQFTDNSICYDGVPGGSACTKPNDNYSWTFTGPGTVNYDDPLTPTLENPVVSFSDPGNWTVKLEVTDSGGFMCLVTKNVNVSLPLPEWKEIIPK